MVSGDGARLVDVTATGFGSLIRSSGATIDRLTALTELDVFGDAVDATSGDFRSGHRLPRRRLVIASQRPHRGMEHQWQRQLDRPQ